MKQDFMLIGASKCATSTISSLLNQHPDIYMVRDETQFFCNDAVFAKGLDWYEQQFADARPDQVLGDRNNLYTMQEVFPNTISRIYQYNPRLKFIYCVRNPIERIESYWIQIRSHGGEKLHHDFNQSVRVNRDWLVDASNYWKQINLYRSYFPDEQIHIVFFEDYKLNPAATIESCFEFIGVNPGFELSTPHLHLNPSKGKKVPSKLLSTLRSYDWFRYAAKAVPQAFRKKLKRQLLFQKMQGKPDWGATEFQWVKDNLQGDIERFLEFYGKRIDYWSFERSITA